MSEEALDLKDVENDKDTVPIPKAEQLHKLAALAKQMQNVEDWITTSEARVAAQKERLRRLSEDTIPSIMQELGIRNFTLDNGFKIEVKPYFSMKIPEANIEEAYDWLEKNNHGEIVKHSLTIETRMTNEKLLEAIRALAEKMKLDIKDKLGIHHMTGSSWVKEQITSGQVIPRELLGVYQGFKTKIKR
jgi:hypothetical protein